MKNKYALNTAVSSALTSVRRAEDLSNKELFTILFEVIPNFLPLELDARKKRAKEQNAAVEAFNAAARNLIQFMN